MNKFAILIGLFAFGAAFNSHAVEFKEAGWQVKGQVDSKGWPITPKLGKVGRGELVPTVTVAEILPTAHEAPLETIERAAQVAGAYTEARGFEACATICKAVSAEGAVSVAIRLRTNFSQLACRSNRTQDECPDGFTPTQETIHTHPEAEIVWANPVDAVFTSLRRGQKARTVKHEFSPNDIANGSGFLVTSGLLLYQNFNNRSGTILDYSSPDEEAIIISSAKF